jgi:hypothetical protein
MSRQEKKPRLPWIIKTESWLELTERHEKTIYENIPTTIASDGKAYWYNVCKPGQSVPNAQFVLWLMETYHIKLKHEDFNHKNKR